ncbi:hypothetical protein V8C40DRAFT_250179 [Trichoderma camerunense]
MAEGRILVMSTWYIGRYISCVFTFLLCLFFFLCSSSLPLVELFFTLDVCFGFFSCFPLLVFLDGDERWFPFYLWGCREELGRWRNLLQVEGKKKKNKSTWAERGGKKRRMMLGFGVFLRGQWSGRIQ